LIFWQRSPKHAMEKRQPLQQMVLGKLDIHCRRLKLHASLLFCTSINSKRIKCLIVWAEAAQLLQEKYGKHWNI
jgi:hypothetical protein